MKRMYRFLALITLVAATSGASPSGFKVVVNPQTAASSLRRADLSAMLLKKTARWSDGTAVVPVDQAATSSVRAKISVQIHGKSAAAVKSYWDQQVFSGRLIPPIEKASDEEVLRFVRTTPGAIGYVSDAAQVAGVKVVALE